MPASINKFYRTQPGSVTYIMSMATSIKRGELGSCNRLT